MMNTIPITNYFISIKMLMSVLKCAAETAELGQLHNCGFTRDFLFLKHRVLFSAYFFL